MTSRTTILTVVTFLGVISLACIGGGIALTWTDHTVPDQIWNLAIFCTGALGAILASTRGTLGEKDVEPNAVTLAAPPMVVAQPIEPGVQGP